MIAHLPSGWSIIYLFSALDKKEEAEQGFFVGLVKDPFLLVLEKKGKESLLESLPRQ